MDLSFLAPEGCLKEVYQRVFPGGFACFSLTMLVLELPPPLTGLALPCPVSSLTMLPGLTLPTHYLDLNPYEGGYF